MCIRDSVCTALLAIPPYVPVLADILSLAAPEPRAWLIIAAMSLAPLLIIQAAALLRRGIWRPASGNANP